jgi:predicted acetyltransferase
MPTQFERPHAALADSYRALVGEFTARGEPLIPFPLAYDNADFNAFMAKLDDSSHGVGLPDGWVPNSTFWLVDEGEVVAVSNLRHRLTYLLRIEGGNIGYGVRPSARRRGHATTLLRHTLGEARAVGLDEVLLTCDKTNTGSVATIVRCGGRLDSEEFIAARGEVLTLLDRAAPWARFRTPSSFGLLAHVAGDIRHGARAPRPGIQPRHGRVEHTAAPQSREWGRGRSSM